MTNTLKIVLFSFAGVLLVIILFFYFSFAGFPWQKIIVGQKILAYLEEKYGEPFEIQQRYYNFKDGHYGIKAFPVKEPNLVFNAEEGWGNHEFIDYYPEAVWTEQARADFKDIVNKTYPDHQRYHISTVYGEGVELVPGPRIPNYLESKAFIDVHVNMPYRFEENDENLERMFTLIQFAEKNGGNIHLFIVYEPPNTDTKDAAFYISFTNEEIQKINSIEDVKRYYSIHNE